MSAVAPVLLLAALIAGAPLAAALDAEAGRSQTVLAGQMIAFDGSASRADAGSRIVGYFWSFGDGATAEGVSASHAYARAGVYAAILTVVDDHGTSASDHANVTVLEADGPSLRHTPPVGASPGTSVQLWVELDAPAGARSVTLHWSNATGAWREIVAAPEPDGYAATLPAEAQAYYLTALDVQGKATRLPEREGQTFRLGAASNASPTGAGPTPAVPSPTPTDSEQGQDAATPLSSVLPLIGACIAALALQGGRRRMR